jgi:hypothetical protein
VFFPCLDLPSLALANFHEKSNDAYNGSVAKRINLTPRPMGEM